MSEFSSYGLVIAASLIIIISYFFNIISRKTNVPSVLLLILLGILINESLIIFGIKTLNLLTFLEVFGIVGLILIVLEAALDLELTKDKWPIIWKSGSIALLSLIVTTFIISLLFKVFLNTDIFVSMIYAIPLSIMSSAIVIPSVVNLDNYKKEFMIYESAISDILGIMFFYFLIESAEIHGAGKITLSILTNVSITIVISILLSYLLIYIFQKIKTKVKLFLLIAVLTLLYTVGKMLHLSSLIVILTFGLMLHNRHIFFRGKLKKLIIEDAIDNIYKTFKVITIESSFVVRTFFFVIFGLTISLASLLKIKVIIISILVLAILYGIRFLLIRLFFRKDNKLLLYIAPRGLITILLFFAIPEQYHVEEFDSGILLFIIIVSSIIMAVALVKNKKSIKEQTEEPDTINSEFTEKTDYNSDILI
ncbi:MAG: cation:proton antiporter [Bacteroidales bacterium]|nr:cation:proton antiporter [Bacteroidales bacterium]